MIPAHAYITGLRTIPPLSPRSRNPTSMGAEFIEKAATGSHREVDELLDCTAIQPHHVGEAFQKACENGHIKVAELIRERKREDILSGHLAAALCFHVKKESSLGPIRFLYEKFEDLLSPEDKKLIFVTAILEGPLSVVRLILHTADECVEGLKLSAKQNNPEIFLFLLDSAYYREASSREIEEIFLLIAQHCNLRTLIPFMLHPNFSDVSPNCRAKALEIAAKHGRHEMLMNNPLQFKMSDESGHLFEFLSAEGAGTVADAILQPYNKPKKLQSSTDLDLLKRKLSPEEAQVNEYLGILCNPMARKGGFNIPLNQLTRIAAPALFQAICTAINHNHPEVAVSIIYSPAFIKIPIPQVEQICLLACEMAPRDSRIISVILAIIRPRELEEKHSVLLSLISKPVLESCFVKACELGQPKIFHPLVQSNRFGDIGEDALKSCFVKVARKALPHKNPPTEYTEIFHAFFKCGRFNLITSDEFYLVFLHVIESGDGLTLNELVNSPCFAPGRLSKNHLNLLFDQIVAQANIFMLGIFLRSKRSLEISKHSLERIYEPLILSGQPSIDMEENVLLSLKREEIIEEISKHERFSTLFPTSDPINPILGAIFLAAAGLGFISTTTAILSQRGDQLSSDIYTLAFYQTGWSPANFLVLTIQNRKIAIQKIINAIIIKEHKGHILDTILKCPSAKNIEMEHLVNMLLHAISNEDEGTVNALLRNRTFAREALVVAEKKAINKGLGNIATTISTYKTGCTIS